jgi:ammonium transporter Rh
MTFVHTYSWSAVGYNFLMSALAVQWSIITKGFFENAYTHIWEHVELDIFSLIAGNFGAGALMISFGAVLGKTSATQLIIMTIFEMIFYSMNEVAVVHQLNAIDMGGSMVIHTFGAFFGLAVSWMIGNPAEGKASPSYTKWSSTVAMVGTIFLW